MTGNQIAYWDYKTREGQLIRQTYYDKEDLRIRDYLAKVQDTYNRGLLAIQQNQLYEQARHNREQEALTRAHNVAQERLASATLLLNSSLESRRIDETIRHNEATERETKNYNAAKLAEDVRSNQAREELTRQQNVTNQEKNSISWGNLALGVGGLLVTSATKYLWDRKKRTSGGNTYNTYNLFN